MPGYMNHALVGRLTEELALLLTLQVETELGGIAGGLRG